MNKLVIFDIDRTIYNGSIFLDYSLHLIQKNLISPKFLSSIGFEFVTYQTGFESYDELVRDCLNYFFEEIKTINPETLKKELKECILKNHHKFYDFSFLTTQNYPNYDYLIISLEPEFIVEEVAKLIKIPNYVCNKFMGEGKFLSKPNLIFDKEILLNQTKFKDHVPFATFGDSESDLKLLLKAENMFVINPTSNLQKELKSKQHTFYNPDNIFENISKVFKN